VTFRAKVALELMYSDDRHVSSRGRDDQGGTRVKTAMTFKVVAGQHRRRPFPSTRRSRFPAGSPRWMGVRRRAVGQAQ